MDLRASFSRDVVTYPGDESNDPLDSAEALLIIDGFDGTPVENPAAQGLPRNRILKSHRLGDYSEPNAVQLTVDDDTPLRIEVTSFERKLVCRPYPAI